MGRFLQSKKDHADSGPSLEGDAKDGCQTLQSEPASAIVTNDMDREMLHQCDKSIKDLISFHIAAWRKLRHSPATAQNLKWGQRRFRKMSVFNELRLQGGSADPFVEGAIDIQLKTGVFPNLGSKRSRTEFEDGGGKLDKAESEWEEPECMAFTDLSGQDSRTDSLKALYFQSKRRKLLQFDKSHRPAFYGSFSQKSDHVKGRNPLKLDANIDYEVDSDEEWEEEDPGESLSDCDKDEEDEKVDVEDDDENADGFVVPDGYLSESEGARVDDAESDSNAELSAHDTSASRDAESVENKQSLELFGRQRKILEHLTEQALRCNRPYIICNFDQNKTSAAGKTERLCLEALRILAMTHEVSIEVPNQEAEKQQGPARHIKECKRPKLKKVLDDTALPDMVEVLLSNSHGMKKTVDILSAKFPAVSWSQLRTKVREVCEFVDNRWQVKKEILERLGIKLPSVQAHLKLWSKPLLYKPWPKALLYN